MPKDDDPFNDTFKPVTRDDMTDLALLPRRFDMFAYEVKQSFETLTGKILPFMQRVEHAINDLSRRVGDLEQAKHAIHDRLAALERRRPRTSKRKAK